MAGPDWGAPTWSNTISTGPSYKTLAMMKEYSKHLVSGDDPHLIEPEAFVYSYTATTINWGKSFDELLKKSLESAPSLTPEPKEPPAPVMPERLT